MVEWMDNIEMAIQKVCASKVYTSAEFKREKDNFQVISCCHWYKSIFSVGFGIPPIILNKILFVCALYIFLSNFKLIVYYSFWKYVWNTNRLKGGAYQLS